MLFVRVGWCFLMVCLLAGEKMEEKREAAEESNGDREAVEPTLKKSKIDMGSLPTRQYLDQTVVPILLQGLSALSKER